MPLYKQPNSPFWWYSITVRGRRIRASTELPYGQKTKSAALAIEAAARLSLQRGDTLPTVAAGCTLRELSVRFLEWVARSQDLSPNTRTYYEYGWRLLYFSQLAPVRVDQLTRDDVSCTAFVRPVICRRTLKPTGEVVPCSPTYTAQALRTLKVMLGKAEEWNLIGRRPRISVAAPPGREALIHAEQEQQMQAYCHDTRCHRHQVSARRRLWVFVVLLQDSGVRPDEAYPMRLEHIDWPGARIWIPRGKTGNSRRWVSMSDRLLAALVAWLATLAQPGQAAPTEGWLFPNPRAASGHVESMSGSFRSMCNRLGLDRRLVLYSTRHTYGTYTMEATGNVFAVSKSMGHADIKSMAPYQHPSLNPIATAINQRNQQRDAPPLPGHTPGHTTHLLN